MPRRLVIKGLAEAASSEAARYVERLGLPLQDVTKIETMAQVGAVLQVRVTLLVDLDRVGE